jgi:ABC-2 type transport system ATP-binding protein
MSAASAISPITSATDILELKNVSKRFHIGKREVRALEAVSFVMQPGAVTGLIGPDGAGKTTLMRLVAGLLCPDGGEIRVLGIDAAKDPQSIQSSIGYMPQRFGLYEDLTVQENLDLYADLQGVLPGDRLKRYEDLMRMTNLGAFRGRLAGRLSGGMKQKLGLACALVRGPRLILLDEPTVGVDPVSRRELWAIVYRLVENQGVSVLLSTAYLDEAQRCRDVVLMSEGRILHQGPPSQFTQPLTGRTFQMHVPGITKRSLMRELGGRPEVVDAVIIGDDVRVVLSRAPEAQKQVTAAFSGAVLVAVPPRFEDSFVDTLRVGKGEPPPTPSAKPAAVLPAAPVAIVKTIVPPPKAAGAVIEVKNLTKQFGAFYAVHDISFSVAPGKIFGLLGANGAGKSTTFRMLCGLLPISGGMLRVAGHDLRTARAAARGRVGYMSQKFSLYGNLSVMENLRFFASAYGLMGRNRSRRIDEVLGEFGLSAVADMNSGGLPLGFKQRLALAAALMHKPDILFLDEPTSGVDPLARREFWHRINALVDAGVTIMVTTHFMEEAEYCDELAIMAAGRILSMGTPAQIRHSAATPANTNPTMEDAFINLIESAQRKAA